MKLPKLLSTSLALGALLVSSVFATEPAVEPEASVEPPEITFLEDSHESRFDDLKGHWGAPVVEHLVEQGIFNGKSEKHFDAHADFTNAELLVIVSRTLFPDADYSSDSPVWYDPFYNILEENELLSASFTHEAINMPVVASDLSFYLSTMYFHRLGVSLDEAKIMGAFMATREYMPWTDLINYDGRISRFDFSVNLFKCLTPDHTVEYGIGITEVLPLEDLLDSEELLEPEELLDSEEDTLVILVN